MRSKKMIVGISAMALAVATATTAFAASATDSNYKDKISLGAENASVFEEKDNLPEGVVYQDEISFGAEGTENASIFEEKDNLPEGVVYQADINRGY